MAGAIADLSAPPDDLALPADVDMAMDTPDLAATGNGNHGGCSCDTVGGAAATLGGLQWAGLALLAAAFVRRRRRS